MRSSRALLFLAGALLAACGGILGFGDDDDVPPPTTQGDDASFPDGNADFEGGSTVDAAVFDAIPSDDAAIDVIDTTPLDAAPGSGLLVVARFENAIQGGDGADTADNMAQSKVDRIGGDNSALTQSSRPAVLAWTFPPQDHVFVSFSFRMLVVPAGAGAELVRVTGVGDAVSLLVTGNGLLGVRSGTNVAGSSVKMQTGIVYRIGMELSTSPAVVKIGVTDGDAGSGIPTLAHQIPWTSGSVDTFEIRTNDAMFQYVVDDVIVSTKGVTQN